MIVTRPRRMSKRIVRGNQLRLESLEGRRLLAGDTALELTRFESNADLQEFLVNDAVEKWSGLFGQPAWHAPWGCPECAFFDVAAGGPERQSHSDTNTQVAGVDEADLVETDGDYLYLIAGQELIIADAWTPQEMQLSSRIQLDGLPIGQFLNGDRLTVISNAQDEFYHGPFWRGGPFVDIAIDVALPYFPYEPRTKLTVYDVADRSNPTVIQSTELDGSYISSRAIGDHVYLVSSSNFGLPHPEIICEEVTDESELLPESGCHYESQDQYLQRIEQQGVETVLPQYSTSNGEGDTTTGVLSQATDIFKPVTDEFYNLISISVFDMGADELGPVSSTSVPTTYATTLYASSDSLYLTNPFWGAGRGGQEGSSVFKFDIVDGGTAVDLAAVGEVPGRLLNAFSMDEYDAPDGSEYLRVATTSGWGEDSDNRVYVLQESGDSLDVVGQTPRLAPGEQIFSVRYVGETGYVVTFRQTDPLFTIDLSNPSNPQVTGELHIPGFSNYLQPANEDFLIGLGRNADPETGRAQELQISLFDVSDATQPLLADRYSFDLPGWAHTEAIGDHHALSYYPDHNVLAIPVNNGNGWVSLDRDGDGRPEFQSYRPQTDLYVFQLHFPTADPTSEPRIEFLGTIEHATDVRRSVRIEEFLYSISSDSVAVHPLLNPDEATNRLVFNTEDTGVEVFKPDQATPIFETAIRSPNESAPLVTKAMVTGTSWNADVIHSLNDSLGLNETELEKTRSIVPFAGTDQIKLQFSEDVLVQANDLAISGTSQAGRKLDYGIRNFQYDRNSLTAVWTLARPLESETVSLRLHGVRDLAGERLDGNANGVAGGTFRYQFHVLPGDVDRDGRVDRADLASAMVGHQRKIGDDGYRLSQDVDGNGVVDTTDYGIIEGRLGTTVPGFVAPVVGDSNRDGVFNERDLIAVMQGGKYRTGEFATMSEGDWNRDGLFDESDLVFAFQKGQYTPSGVAAAVDAAFADDD